MRKAAFILLAVFFLACGGSEKNKTVEFWQFWTDPKARPVIESIVNEFEQENPGWKVNVTDLTWSDGHQKIVVAFGAGQPPDILELGSDWIAEFAAGHVLSEIDIDTSQFVLTDPGIFDYEIYAQPWFVASRIFFFNESLFDKADIKIPRDWQQLLEVCRSINALSDDIAGFGANSAEPHRLYKKFLPFVWSCGGDIIKDGKISIDNPEVLTALEFYGELARCGQVETQRHLEDAFVDGNIGFIISGGWLLKRLQDNPPDFEYRLVPMLPRNEGGKAFSFAGGEYLVIPQKSTFKEGARKLMEIIMRPENIAALCDSVGFGFAPYKQRIRENLAPDEEILFVQLQHSRSTPVNPRWIYVEKIIENMVEQVTLGQLTPQQAIADAQAKIDETLQY
jgi:multiple sugar transport system substrate-binding protein